MFNYEPRIISTADKVNIGGQSLNGKKLTLKPVNKETTASTIKTAAEER